MKTIENNVLNFRNLINKTLTGRFSDKAKGLVNQSREISEKLKPSIFDSYDEYESIKNEIISLGESAEKTLTDFDKTFSYKEVAKSSTLQEIRNMIYTVYVCNHF